MSITTETLKDFLTTQGVAAEFLLESGCKDWLDFEAEADNSTPEASRYWVACAFIFADSTTIDPDEWHQVNAEWERHLSKETE